MNLFAYGTLMWPEVLESVMGRRVAGTEAVLADYVRLRVKDQHYPAVVQSAGDSTKGLLYRGLTTEEFRCLDAFEGEEYDRIEADIAGTRAFVYVLSSRWRHIAEPKRWHPEELRPEMLARFCADYKGWSDLEDL